MACFGKPPFAEPLREDGQRLGGCELGADAGPRPAPERQILEAVAPAFLGKSVDVERIGIVPIFAVAVQHPRPNRHNVAWLHRMVADAIASGRTDYANLEAAGRAELARNGWKVDYMAVRHGLALRIPHPEGYDHPNLLIVLAAATLGTTRLIDNVDVIRKDGED